MTPRSPSVSAGSLRHLGGGEAHHVEGADEIDLDHPGEFLQGQRAVPAEDAAGNEDAGDIDQDAGGTMGLGRGGHRGLAAGGARDVAFQPQPADLLGHGLGPLAVQVENRDLRPRFCQMPRHIGADARAPAGDDGRLALDLHSQLLCPKRRSS